jgi:hypothetical protein
MNRAILTACILAGLASSCRGTEESSLLKENEPLLAEAAGMLARNLAYAEGHRFWSPPPGPETIDELSALAVTSVELWPMFFKFAADSAAKLELLEVQARQEELQLQLL